MIYTQLRRWHPWIDYIAAVVLLITGFRLVIDEQWIGFVHLVAGIAILLTRVATARRPERSAGEGSL